MIRNAWGHYLYSNEYTQDEVTDTYPQSILNLMRKSDRPSKDVYERGKHRLPGIIAGCVYEGISG